MALVSSTTSWRRPSNRVPAPAKVKAMISPSGPKMAPSAIPVPGTAPGESAARAPAPRRRPSSMSASMAPNSATAHAERENGVEHGRH
jgi:hypothetical protein